VEGNIFVLDMLHNSLYCFIIPLNYSRCLVLFCVVYKETSERSEYIS
jgi:hypothetical protein